MSHIKLFMLLPNYNNNRISRKFTFACYTTQSRQTVYFNEIFVEKNRIKLGALYATIIIIVVKFYNIYVDMVNDLKSRAFSTV